MTFGLVLAAAATRGLLLTVVVAIAAPVMAPIIIAMDNIVVANFFITVLFLLFLTIFPECFDVLLLHSLSYTASIRENSQTSKYS